MRMYGLRSGRNNINKLIARSYMYNSSKNKPVNETNNNKNNNKNEEVNDIFIIGTIFCFLLFISCCQ